MLQTPRRFSARRGVSRSRRRRQSRTTRRLDDRHVGPGTTLGQSRSDWIQTTEGKGCCRSCASTARSSRSSSESWRPTRSRSSPNERSAAVIRVTAGEATVDSRPTAMTPSTSSALIVHRSSAASRWRPIGPARGDDQRPLGPLSSSPGYARWRSRCCCSCAVAHPKAATSRTAMPPGTWCTGHRVLRPLLGFVVFLAFEASTVSRSGARRSASSCSRPKNARFFPRPAGSVLTAARLLRTIGRQRRVGRGCARARREKQSTRGVWRSFAHCKPCNRRQRPSSLPTTNGSSRHPRGRTHHNGIHGAVGVIPTTLWIVLFFIAAVIFVFMLFFADRGRRSGHVDRIGSCGRNRDVAPTKRAQPSIP